MKKTLPDTILEYFAPIKAAQRMKARALIGAYEKGGYNGASRSRAALSNYNPVSGDVNDDTIADLPTLRSRSRDLQRNTPIAGGAIHTLVVNVVGTGLTLQSRIDATKLGLSGAEAEIWQDDVSARFEAWASSPDCDAARKLNFYGIQELAFRSELSSGDVGALLTQAERYGKIHPVVQLIEADRISNPDNKRDTDRLVQGVEMNEAGESIRVHICNQHPSSWKKGIKKKWTAVDIFGKETGRRNFVLKFDMLRPDQVRGIPILAPVIEPLKQLGRYTEAELQAAVVSGAFAIFMKMDPNAFSELFDTPAQANYIQSAAAWNGQYPASTLEGPGKVVNLLPGEEPMESNPGRPNSEFDPFVQAILRQIGCELGLPFEVLIKHFTSSYAAARAALLDAWRMFRVRREKMAMYFCQPIYEDWLAREIAEGRIVARGFFEDPLIRQYWCSADWIGDGPGSIDPSKEVSAAIDRIESGISTLQNESILHDGGDWWAKHKQRTREHAVRVSAGLEADNKAMVAK